MNSVVQKNTIGLLKNIMWLVNNIIKKEFSFSHNMSQKSDIQIAPKTFLNN